MSQVRVIVMDEPCDPAQAFELTSIYLDRAVMAGAIAHGTEMIVDFSSDDGIWIGGDLASDVRKALAQHLEEVRRPRMPYATTLGFSDPFASDFFDREPDAWLVSGGGEPTLRVESRDAMNAEMERRKSKLSKSI